MKSADPTIFADLGALSAWTLFCRRVIAALIVLQLCLLISTNPASAQTSEYTMKAVYLERFSRFIDWPESAGIDDTSRPFIVTVIGENPFGESLEAVFENQKILKKRVVVTTVDSVEQVDSCHLLFVAASEEDAIEHIVEEIRGKGILTIGDTEGFAEKGILINLYLADGKVRFEINETAVKESDFTISYHLMRMAKIVHSGGGRP